MRNPPQPSHAHVADQASTTEAVDCAVLQPSLQPAFVKGSREEPHPPHALDVGTQQEGHAIPKTSLLAVSAVASGDDQQQPPHVPERASTSGAMGRATLETSSVKASGEDSDRPPALRHVPDRASIAEAVGRAILQISDLKASVEARLAASEGKLASIEQLVSMLVEQKFAALQVEAKALADASAAINKLAAAALQIETDALIASAQETVDALVHESASIISAREKRMDKRMAVAEEKIRKKLASAHREIEERLAAANMEIKRRSEGLTRAVFRPLSSVVDTRALQALRAAFWAVSSRLYGFMPAICIARVGHHSHAHHQTPARERAYSLGLTLKRCCISNPLMSLCGGSVVALLLLPSHAGRGSETLRR